MVGTSKRRSSGWSSRAARSSTRRWTRWCWTDQDRRRRPYRPRRRRRPRRRAADLFSASPVLSKQRLSIRSRGRSRRCRGTTQSGQFGAHADQYSFGVVATVDGVEVHVVAIFDAVPAPSERQVPLPNAGRPGHVRRHRRLSRTGADRRRHRQDHLRVEADRGVPRSWPRRDTASGRQRSAPAAPSAPKFSVDMTPSAPRRQAADRVRLQAEDRPHRHGR